MIHYPYSKFRLRIKNILIGLDQLYARCKDSTILTTKKWNTISCAT